MVVVARDCPVRVTPVGLLSWIVQIFFFFFFLFGALLFGLLSIGVYQHVLLQRAVIERFVLAAEHGAGEMLLLAALVLLMALQRYLSHIAATAAVARKTALFAVLP